MRKITFLLLFLVSSFWVDAQTSSQLTDLQKIDIDSDTIAITGSINDNSSFNVINTNNTFLNNPFPLPANNFVKFDYNLRQGDIAAIVFYDILGNEVRRNFLSSGLNQIKINTSELKTGVFLYALIVNGNKTKMGRIMVKH